MEAQYQPQLTEPEAQQFWQDHHCFRVSERSDADKFYCLSMFPYPSGRLHMGHVRNYTIGDVISRYQRMLGKNVLQPMGWDAFGLPAENAAIKHQMSAADWTTANIADMKEQMRKLGFAYDWERELSTCQTEYYQWEQWLFLQMYERGLIYKADAEVNWDPVDQTVLANEQVIDGRGWRSGALIERRKIPQWFFKITHYADDLLAGLSTLNDWPTQVKTMQHNWLGRSEGVEIDFQVLNSDYPTITIFTTRADTLFGVTCLALAPQHPIAEHIAQTNQDIAAFISSTKNIKVAEADIATITKQGMYLGIDARHPITGQPVPIWVTNFVLGSYGTGAIMVVPAHDSRDFEFAAIYQLPCIPVIEASQSWDYSTGAYTGEGLLINAGEFTGLVSSTARTAIAARLLNTNMARPKINYRLRDWSISRQRYWGTPIPIINCPNCGPVPAPLPVVLPSVSVSTSTGPLNLSNIPEFVNITCPQCAGPAQRETDTFDTFFESSWYFARFASYNQHNSILDERANYWLPVDQYIGGIEHAILHLLYARFISMVLHDLGLLNVKEPFTRLLSQGMVLNDGAKMSKSKGNVVDPERLIASYGADTLRLFIIFAAPPEQSLEWSDSGVLGAGRFLKRLWALAYQHHAAIITSNQEHSHLDDAAVMQACYSAQPNLCTQISKLLQQINYDYQRNQFNTVVSGCMKMLNILSAHLNSIKQPLAQTEALILTYIFGLLLRLLAPITPHITHKLWHSLAYPEHIHQAPWPKQAQLNDNNATIAIQINGKTRTTITTNTDISRDDLTKLAISNPKISKLVEPSSIKKVIIVPHKIVNIVL